MKDLNADRENGRITDPGEIKRSIDKNLRGQDGRTVILIVNFVLCNLKSVVKIN